MPVNDRGHRHGFAHALPGFLRWTHPRVRQGIVAAERSMSRGEKDPARPPAWVIASPKLRRCRRNRAHEPSRPRTMPRTGRCRAVHQRHHGGAAGDRRVPTPQPLAGSPPSRTARDEKEHAQRDSAVESQGRARELLDVNRLFGESSARCGRLQSHRDFDAPAPRPRGPRDPAIDASASTRIDSPPPATTRRRGGHLVVALVTA